MKELVVISGKGGSGKTSVSSSFISLAGRCIICDCDVESPNLHILLTPATNDSADFSGMPKAFINQAECIQCDNCIEACRFSAISQEYQVIEHKCEGCTVCHHICPAGAIEMVPHTAGQWYHSQTKYGSMFHANLGIGEKNSGKLVALLREKARNIAKDNQEQLIITDGPPGIGCPTIAALSNADLAVIVAEPTMSAIHDMLRTIELCEHFNIKHGIIINKKDLNLEKAGEIQAYCNNKNIPVLGEIPFHRSFREAVNNCQPPVEYSKNIRHTFIPVWNNVNNLLSANE